jgi:hypothetical protein
MTKLHAVFFFAAGVGVGWIVVGTLVPRTAHLDREQTVPKIVLQPPIMIAVAVEAGAADWYFVDLGRSTFSDDTPDCAGIVSPPLPESTAHCTPSNDGRDFECGAWHVGLTGIHPNAGYAMVRATYLGLGSAGDPCEVVFHGNARR